MANEVLGYKYQIYEDGKLKVYRISSYKNIFTAIGIDVETKEKRLISKTDLSNKYVKLTADALMNIMVTDKNEKNRDVYVCINACNRIKHTPDIILRQQIYSATKNQLGAGNIIYVGDCVSDSTDLSGSILGLTFNDYLEFNSIDYMASFAIYIDDTIDDIIMAIDPKTIKYTDMVLKSIKYEFENPNIVGYTESIKDLMVENNFITRFKELFNITHIDWPIDLGEESHNTDGDLILNNKQISNLQDIVRQYMKNVKAIKYAKDIDIMKIVSYHHIMISDSTDTIYLIVYESDGDYPVDDDIMRVMNV